jgi:hypothetical protein
VCKCAINLITNPNPVYTHTHTRDCMYVCMYVYMYVCVYICMHNCTCVSLVLKNCTECTHVPGFNSRQRQVFLSSTTSKLARHLSISTTRRCPKKLGAHQRSPTNITSRFLVSNDSDEASEIYGDHRPE